MRVEQENGRKERRKAGGEGEGEGEGRGGQDSPWSEAGPMKFIICRSSSGVGDNGARVALGLASFLFKF